MATFYCSRPFIYSYTVRAYHYLLQPLSQTLTLQKTSLSHINSLQRLPSLLNFFPSAKASVATSSTYSHSIVSIDPVPPLTFAFSHLLTPTSHAGRYFSALLSFCTTFPSRSDRYASPVLRTTARKKTSAPVARSSQTTPLKCILFFTTICSSEIVRSHYNVFVSITTFPLFGSFSSSWTAYFLISCSTLIPI